MPKDVGPIRWFNEIVGTCLLIIAAVAAVPVGAALYYDGLASIFDWPALFNWLSAFVASFFGTGLYLLATPQRVGGWVTFRHGGFSIRVRRFILKDEDHDVDWSQVQQVQLGKAARQNDGLTIILKRGAPISFRTGYFEFGGDEVVARLSTSAEAANYKLEKASSFDALIVQQQTWRVLPKS